MVKLAGAERRAVRARLGSWMSQCSVLVAEAWEAAMVAVMAVGVAEVGRLAIGSAEVEVGLQVARAEQAARAEAS